MDDNPKNMMNWKCGKLRHTNKESERENEKWKFQANKHTKKNNLEMWQDENLNTINYRNKIKIVIVQIHLNACVFRVCCVRVEFIV